MCKARFLLDGLMQGKYDLREQTADGTKTGETGLKYFFFVFSWQSFSFMIILKEVTNAQPWPAASGRLTPLSPTPYLQPCLPDPPRRYIQTDIAGPGSVAVYPAFCSAPASLRAHTRRYSKRGPAPPPSPGPTLNARLVV